MTTDNLTAATPAMTPEAIIAELGAAHPYPRAYAICEVALDTLIDDAERAAADPTCEWKMDILRAQLVRARDSLARAAAVVHAAAAARK